jgi:hypothetical protein
MIPICLLQCVPAADNAKSFSQGDLVLCAYEGCLCRALVERVEGRQVTIFYMDYGNSETTTLEALLPMPKEIANLPPAVKL